MPRVKVVGKPYEGEPHVRFEVAGAGNGFLMRRNWSKEYRASTRPY